MLCEWVIIGDEIKTHGSLSCGPRKRGAHKRSEYIDRNNKVTEAVTDQEKADALNSHFSSVFTNEDISSIPLIDDIYTSSPITDISISDNVLFNKLQNLDTSKSPGPDGWHQQFLKESAVQLIVPLRILFQKFLDSGFIPKEW